MMKVKFVCYFLVTVLILNAILVTTSLVQSLNGPDWTLTGPDNISAKAVIPGSVHTDLYRNSLIPEPLYRMNDDALRWIGTSDWNYSRQFHVEADFLNHQRVDLVCGGLDTISTIIINDVVIANTSNMFRRYVFNVGKILKEGSNKVVVAFKSPVIYTSKQAAAYSYPVPPKCPPAVQNGECSFNFIRKEACSFSWDWGPSFPTMGIWKNITLEAYNAAVIRYVTTETLQVDGRWQLKVVVFFEVEFDFIGKLELNMPELGVSHQEFIPLAYGSAQHEFILPVTSDANIVELWWPNGLGQQNLYRLSVKFSDSFGDLDERTLHVGFRSVELVQDVVSGLKSGYTFYFKINGVPVFMKGSNWIPANSFQERITRAYIEKLLVSAVEANMNMLRVWGGGVYESEEFYNLADKYGIMIWQDFMFACALYPTNGDFISNVRSEVEHQVRRLKRHPSIAIWSGNNENEGALSNNWFNISNADYKRYYNDYVHLYIDTVYSVIKEEDTSRPFVPSSPSNGLDTIAEGWVQKIRKVPDTEIILMYFLYRCPISTAHYYNYTMDSWNSSLYPVPRFASEFGLQSWCSFETLEPVSLPVDWDIESNFVYHRQHHDQGEDQMMNELSLHLIPPTSKNRTKQFIDFIYLTQINQAVGIKTEVELYRRQQSQLVDGEGLTMGSLYWQLNDIWQAPTWASIEFGGKWKMLHYFAKRFFGRSIISPFLSNDNLHVFFIMDDNYSNKSQTNMDNRGFSEFNDLSYLSDTSYRRLNFRHNKNVLNQMGPSKDDGLGRQSNNLQSEFVNKEQPSTEIFNLKIYCFMWSSLKASLIRSKEFNKPKYSSEEVFTEKLQTLLDDCRCLDATKCFFFFTGGCQSCADQSSDNQNSTPFNDNYLFLSNLSSASGIKAANLLISNITLTSASRVDMLITTDQIALFVWLEAKGYPGRFSDNGFLMASENVHISFQAWATIDDLQMFSKSLSITSLSDVYQ